MTIVRIFQVFGEGESRNRFWPSINKMAESGKDFEMTKGEQVRDFINVKTVAEEILIEALSKNRLVSIKNIGSGKPQTLAEFAKKIWEDSNAKGKIFFGSKEYRKGEIFRYVPNIKKRFILKVNEKS